MTKPWKTVTFEWKLVQEGMMMTNYMSNKQAHVDEKLWWNLHEAPCFTIKIIGTFFGPENLRDSSDFQ